MSKNYPNGLLLSHTKLSPVLVSGGLCRGEVSVMTVLSTVTVIAVAIGVIVSVVPVVGMAMVVNLVFHAGWVVIIVNREK